MQFISFILALASIPFINGSPTASDVAPLCKDKTTLSSTYIGQDKNVKAETFECSNAISPSFAATPLFGKRQSDPNNVCGAACTTNCFYPTGGGPNPNDCQVIADALLFESQNAGPLFNITPTGHTAGMVLTYSSCNSTMINQDNVTLTYCYNDWAGVTGYVANNCQSTQNAHGGNCVASDQRWFIQIQHS